jgi:hypothetical protein
MAEIRQYLLAWIRYGGENVIVAWTALVIVALMFVVCIGVLIGSFYMFIFEDDDYISSVFGSFVVSAILALVLAMIVQENFV